MTPTRVTTSHGHCRARWRHCQRPLSFSAIGPGQPAPGGLSSCPVSGLGHPSWADSATTASRSPIRCGTVTTHWAGRQPEVSDSMISSVGLSVARTTVTVTIIRVRDAVTPADLHGHLPVPGRRAKEPPESRSRSLRLTVPLTPADSDASGLQAERRTGLPAVARPHACSIMTPILITEALRHRPGDGPQAQFTVTVTPSLPRPQAHSR